MEFAGGWRKRRQGLEEVGWVEEAERIQEVGFHTVFGEDQGGAQGNIAERGGLTEPRVAPITHSLMSFLGKKGPAALKQQKMGKH